MVANLYVAAMAVLPVGQTGCAVYYIARNGTPGFTRADVPATASRVTVEDSTGRTVTALDGLGSQGGGAHWRQEVVLPMNCSGAGNYLVTVALDSGNQATESTKADNATQILINPASQGLPDLTITSVDCGAQASMTVKNQGTASSPAEPWAATIEITGGGKYLGGANVDLPTIAPGQTVMLSTPYSGPCSGITINDYLNPGLFIESDFQNNQFLVNR